MLPFDKLDVVTGMDVVGPAGEVRRLLHPWSILAFQLAGTEGLRKLTGGADSERDSPPAEPLLIDLLSVPAQAGLATLVLIDETLMFVRQKVIDAPAWREKMVDFFQYLTQAAVKTPGCAVVVSLLATDPRKSDTQGKELMQEMSAIFSREREEIILPVQKEEVAEVLRRRFFRPETIREVEAFRPHVLAALEGIKGHDDTTKKEGRRAEDRYVSSYPFHPELTEVLYTRWGQMESFQRTRGVLRTFAMALRDAEGWDNGPLVGPNIFLKAPTEDGLCDAVQELTNTASSEEYRGQETGVGAHHRRRTGPSPRRPGGIRRAGPPRTGAGGHRHLPAQPTERPPSHRGRPASPAGATPAGPDRPGEGVAPLGKRLLVPR